MSVLQVQVKVLLEIGSSSMTLRKLSALKHGEIVPIIRTTNVDVVIRIADQVIACADLIATDGALHLRVTSVGPHSSVIR